MNARKLRKLFIELDMNRAQVARAIGVSPALMSLMASGKAKIVPRTELQLRNLRRDVVRRSHFVKAAKITGRTVEQLGGADPELEEL